MKNLIVIILIAAGLSTLATQTFAQGQGVFVRRAPEVVTGGEFNGSTVATASSTRSTVQARASTVMPLYTRTVTVTNTGADTMDQELRDYNSSVYTWANVTSVSGTNTSCTVALQVTGDKWTSGVCTGCDWKTIKTYTVTATGNPYDFTVNQDVGTQGWQYTGFRWLFTGVGTHSSRWYCGLNVK